jgi:type II secretory pathway pseudopilin PulG
MNINLSKTRQAAPSGAWAFTLPEVLIAVAIVMFVYNGIILAYIQFDKRMEWSGYSLQAQALSIRSLEDARAAKWDTQSSPVVDNSTNLVLYSVTNLDLPMSGTNMIYATNTTTITNVTISTSPLVVVHYIRVDTTWSFKGHNFTNTIATYRAPDQ